MSVLRLNAKYMKYIEYIYILLYYVYIIFKVLLQIILFCYI